MKNDLVVRSKISINIPENFLDKLGENILMVKSLSGAICLFNEEYYNKFDESSNYICDVSKAQIGENGKLSLTKEDLLFLGNDSLCTILMNLDHVEVWGMENYRNKIRESVRDNIDLYCSDVASKNKQH